MRRSNVVSALTLVLSALLLAAGAAAAPLSATALARLARGEPLDVIVEFDATVADRAAAAERVRRGRALEDMAVLELRTRAHRAVKDAVEAAAAGSDATPVRDYDRFPLALWRVRSAAALARLEHHPSVIRLHENGRLRLVGLSDASFVHVAQAAASGATGAGATVAVIDGGLGDNYLATHQPLPYADFGPCTAVGQPVGVCRVAYYDDYYGNTDQSLHGTNVAAIVLNVATSARLAMFNVNSSTGISFSDVLKALNTVASIRATYNIVAVNMSLSDGKAYPDQQQCANSAFAPAIATLAAAGVQIVAAAGNSGDKTGIGFPACAPGTISVGAVYSRSNGSWIWTATADTGGTCTQASAPDTVACFSQSAAYLTLLAPGTFVDAPDASFEVSGTSQAAPHVAGALAALRARYPSELPAESLQRLTQSGVVDRDTLASGRQTPRMDLNAAATMATALTLSATGPSTGLQGGAGSYVLTASNGGPLAVTNGFVTLQLPPTVAVSSLSSGCTLAGGVVTCSFARLAVNGQTSFTVNVTFTQSGPVYASAAVTADEASNGTAGTTIGPDPAAVGDGPVPPWALLAAGLLVALAGRARLAADPA